MKVMIQGNDYNMSKQCNKIILAGVKSADLIRLR